MSSLQQAASKAITIMSKRNGRWRGEAENPFRPRGIEKMIGSALATFMMSSGTHRLVSAHQQNEYTVAAVIRQRRRGDRPRRDACKEQGRQPERTSGRLDA